MGMGCNNLSRCVVAVGRVTLGRAHESGGTLLSNAPSSIVAHLKFGLSIDLAAEESVRGASRGAWGLGGGFLGFLGFLGGLSGGFLGLRGGVCGGLGSLKMKY